MTDKYWNDWSETVYVSIKVCIFWGEGAKMELNDTLECQMSNEMKRKYVNAMKLFHRFHDASMKI